jgi:hypothetical protein
LQRRLEGGAASPTSHLIQQAGFIRQPAVFLPTPAPESVDAASWQQAALSPWQRPMTER